jgi:hypothetical protein
MILITGSDHAAVNHLIRSGGDANLSGGRRHLRGPPNLRQCRRFLLFGMSGGAAEIMVMLLGRSWECRYRCCQLRYCGLTCSHMV